MARYRAKKVKREHGILAEIEPHLRRIAAHPAVRAVIPGPIFPRSSRATGITFQYQTASGCKLLAKTPKAVQEVFVVTADPGAVRRWLAEENLDPAAHKKSRGR